MYKQNLYLTLDSSLSFYIGCTVFFFPFWTLHSQNECSVDICAGHGGGSHVTQSRSSGPKQEWRRRSRPGMSRGCLQPAHGGEDTCTAWHCSDRVRGPVEVGQASPCACGGDSPPVGAASPAIWEVLLWGGSSCRGKAEPEQGEGRPGCGCQSPSGERASGCTMGDCSQERNWPDNQTHEGDVPVHLRAELQKGWGKKRTCKEVGLEFGLLVRIHNVSMKRCRNTVKIAVCVCSVCECVCVAHLFPSSVCQGALKEMMPEGQQACSSVLASKPMFSYKKMNRAASITEEGLKRSYCQKARRSLKNDAAT